jgi:hypothetical protein
VHKDLISREALKKILSDPLYRSTIKDHGEILKYTFVMDIIDNAPTVDAIVNTVEVRPQGKWIDTGSGQECNVCHEIQYGYDNFRHFCANCGADMQTKENSNG